MSWSTRQRPAEPAAAGSGGSASAVRAPVRGHESGAASADTSGSTASVRRVSNGLKELLGAIEGIERCELLDLGPVSQATVDFFTSRGCRLHTHDLLRGWREFLAEELERPAQSPRAAGGRAARGPELAPGHTGKDAAGDSARSGRNAPLADDGEDPSVRPARFFARHLWFDPRKFHGVLLWDSLDYLDAATGAALVARLAEILRPGGAALLHLHDKTPERFWRYRVLDAQTLECVPATAPVAFQRPIPNREIMNLFHDFRTSKTFVGRDQIREVLFLR
ncbi:MAG TPA: class I SAM-dependent methyltransferase [Candidatus Acidoferrales bacterium]|nr:class I SAM-dependent methyltransferase [Candidatus Acidoferrales bacterium]